MHNGQIGGFEAYRRQAEALITNDLYPHRKGATDSEVLFLLACRLGIESDPQTAMAQAVGLLEAMAEAHGASPPHALHGGFHRLARRSMRCAMPRTIARPRSSTADAAIGRAGLCFQSLTTQARATGSRCKRAALAALKGATVR
jgi:predicted glutamine amidotransferase